MIFHFNIQNMITQIQIESIERVMNNCLKLAKKSPNIAAILDISQDDVERVEAAIKRMRK